MAAPSSSAHAASPLPRDYTERRDWIGRHFENRADRWAALTSAEPVGRIRTTVRDGRDRMRGTLLSYLPDRLDGLRVLDAGCGPGEMAVDLARRGARVVAVDLSPSLVAQARHRISAAGLDAVVEVREGDMLGAARSGFDHVVAMDSLIHYSRDQLAAAVAQLLAGARASLVMTYAPRTPVLAAMHSVGRLFPGRRRAPSIRPVSGRELRRALNGQAARWRVGREARVHSGFYVSHAVELVAEAPVG